MESILKAIVAMGIEEGPVLFHMTAKVIVQSLCKVKEFKDESFKVNACKGKPCNGEAS
jgi:hypothetical protein